MKLKCMLKRWWRCYSEACDEAEELRYRLDTLRERERSAAAKAQQSLIISEGQLSIPSIPLDVYIDDANHFNIHVENGRAQIKTTVLKKR